MTELHILSLGAGVQSTTLALMAKHGDMTPMPSAAIFADTGAEPESVYHHLDWLKAEVADCFPVYRVEAGNIEQDIIDNLEGRPKRMGQAPFYVLNHQTKPDMPPVSGGMLWRQCTQDYKLVPLRRKVRELWQSAGKPHIVQWIGISLDEIQRSGKASGVKYITNRYPLIEARIRRSDCLSWLQAHGYHEPPKSACYFCPYISNHRWRRIKAEEPETFQRAVEFDAKLRTGKLPGVTGDAYVHRSFIPLSEVQFGHEEQMDFEFGFGNECEGMCGV